ncbi:hypothetical protein [Hyalangium versicolor]|uniref:hypothetical protein n=1 Tax=Hyalangium versicolor TaxID=2861190 RepID=UPI001CCE60CB|nr:hypothetical protein [Hyalangium versicolor]
MDPIGRRPATLRPATTSAQSEARPVATAAKTTATNAVDQVGRSTFDAPVVKAAAAQPIPGAWRGGPDTEVGKAIAGMINRMRSSDAAGIQLKGDTIESLFTRAIIDNKHVTNDQLLAMTKMTVDQLSDGPEDSAKILKKIPNARELPAHKFTVAMLAAATGVDPKALSQASPGLGMTGAPDVFIFAAPTEGLQRSTALHDFTDYLRGAGLKGMNKAVWGVENRVLSAIVSAVGGGRY